MGGKLSKHFSREQKTRAKAEAEAESTQGQGSSSIIELIKPECLKRTKRMKKKKRQLNPPERKITKARRLTLEDWLLASPGPSSAVGPAECFSGGELYVFRQFSKTKRVHPSSSAGVQLNEAATTTSKPRDNFSLDEISSISSVVDAASSMSRNQSGKQKKKVSFKLPEEADIIIFYSPPETLGE